MSNYIFGVDLGGTTTKFGLFSMDLTLVDQWVIPTRTEKNGDDFLVDIVLELQMKLTERGIFHEQIKGVGIGVPGAVLNAAFVKPCVNLNGWGGFDVAAELQKRCNWPCWIVNDANAAALGELRVGSERPIRNGVFVTLGTGVGGGIMVDGKLLSGEHGAGGEIGHIKVTDDMSRRCGCGACGCLEQYASATGILTSAQQTLAKQPSGSLMTERFPLTCKDIFDCAQKGDLLAEHLVDVAERMLGKALAAVSCVCDPEVFILGGGVSNAGQFLLNRVQKYFRQYAFPAARDTPFALAQLGSDAGIYGAAYFCQYNLK